MIVMKNADEIGINILSFTLRESLNNSIKVTNRAVMIPIQMFKPGIKIIINELVKKNANDPSNVLPCILVLPNDFPIIAANESPIVKNTRPAIAGIKSKQPITIVVPIRNQVAPV